ncbi:MAG TPA: SRPBCC family protein [Candidatus Omnitrophota bacterium]|nr:SRPBCC family protein [Candidatus Omnitrophota bacterium]HPS21052.1 SRPBCC family protein [Candidatus Omnitrophota bacterium]
MFTIKLRDEVNASPETVFNVITDFENISRCAKSVKEVEILSHDGNKYSTHWSIDFDGAPFSWTEENLVSGTTKTIIFKATEGDFYIYCGEWKVRGNHKGGSVIEIDAYLNLGIPNMEKFIGKTFERKAKKAIKGLILAFKKAAENRNG